MNSRPYSHPEDLPYLIDFLRAVRPPERSNDFPGLVDLEELLADPEHQRLTRLWHDPQGSLSAYAMLSNYDNLLFDTIPAQLAGLGAEIIEWALENARGETGEGLYASCLDDNSVRIDFLQAHGFELQPDTTLHYARPLDQPIPEPSLPSGFSIRPLEGEAEADAAADLHRAAFGTGYMTTATRLAMMRTSEYDPTLDLVVIAPNGRLAAYTMGSTSAAQNARTGHKIGYTDPVAAHPDFQRLGLARALLLTALYMLKQRGMETAKLGTASDNLAMQKTAESAGFRLESKTLWFRRPPA
jgi:ribosomal protein S18 acetylase RimI-like enzyme